MRETRYSQTAMAIHWLVALGIIAAIAMGVYMVALPMSPARLKLFNWHKWLGVSILGLSVVRLVWRLTHRPPADLPMPIWQLRAAHVAHWVMYLLFFAVPLSGWAYSSAAGFPVVLFGVLPLPDLVPPAAPLAVVLKALHVTLAFSLGAVVALHVVAVIKHQLVDRDGILSRMNPWPIRNIEV